LIIDFGLDGRRHTTRRWVSGYYVTRTEQVLVEAGVVGDLATPVEVFAFIYGVSLEIPLNREWTNIYLWCGNEVFTKHKRLKEGQTFWEMMALTGEHPPAAITLSDYEKTQFYNRLARHIRRNVIRAAAERGVAKGSSGHRKAPPAWPGGQDGAQAVALPEPTFEQMFRKESTL
jgi:hypothetical protein